MLIVCPQCGFSRDVSKDRLTGRYVTVTCPKCQCKFRLYQSGLLDVLEDRHSDGETEEDRRIVAARAYEREKRRFEEEKPRENLVIRQVPWEAAPEKLSWPDAFFKTVFGAMFAANKFFPLLRREGSTARPLLFYLIICVFQIVVERLWLEGLTTFFNSAPMEDAQLKELLTTLTPKSGFAISLLLQTATHVLQLYFFSFLMDLGYRLAAPGKSTFTLVFQILAYSSAPQLLCIIPGLGSLTGLVWSIGCVAVGSRLAMRLTWGQVFFGFLPPLLIMLPLLYSFWGIVGK